MTTFADRCGLQTPQRAAACADLLRRLADERIHTVRVVWCDLHGMLRGKALTASALADALDNGVGMVSTLLLKDTADRTAVPVFGPAAPAAPGVPYAGARNLRLLPDPTTLQPLPWAPGSAWLRAEPWDDHLQPVVLDARGVLERNLARLAEHGARLVCGLEVEFHVYRLVQREHDAARDPAASMWPPATPEVELIHPGFHLLSDSRLDEIEPVLDIVRHTAQGLGLPLRSLEIELGPSQVEAVFGAVEALDAADQMVRFRHGVKQALRRAGYLASFMCRPPFAQAVASGWHLHQSLWGWPTGSAPAGVGAPARADEQALWGRARDARGDTPSMAEAPTSAHAALGATGASWLAGFLVYARGMAAFASPTVSGFGRFQGGLMSPLQAVWGVDNRGAMLRLITHADGRGAHLENRLGEPAANPYLYIASQVAAGLDGWARRLEAPGPSADPYGCADVRLPADLFQALDAVETDPLWRSAFGDDLVRLFVAIKRAELARLDAAHDGDEWQRREYFERL
jgi:glutamine synthetase